MCNCENKRNELSSPSFSMSGTVTAKRNRQPIWPDVSFEYTGKTALSVTGNITGKRYRFSHSGDEQLIDYRDASGMRSIAVLRKVNR